MSKESCQVHGTAPGKGEVILEIARNVPVRVGVDLSKRVLQAQAVDSLGRIVQAKSISPERFYAWRSSWQWRPAAVQRRCAGGLAAAHVQHACSPGEPSGVKARKVVI